MTVKRAEQSGQKPTTLDFDVIRNIVTGQWEGVLSLLGIEIPPNRRHGPCPGCGGKDRFRFDDIDGRGTWICGRGGDPIAGDGFALIQHVRNCSVLDAFNAVAQVLGVDVRKGTRQRWNPRDLLLILKHECLVCAAGTGTLLDGGKLTESDVVRMQVAVTRINRALEVANVR